MIQYCPLEEEPKVTYQENRPPIVQDIDTDTECNYLVMFFILGVVVLAITDRIGNR